jgi:hypothetical protein
VESEKCNVEGEKVKSLKGQKVKTKTSSSPIHLFTIPQSAFFCAFVPTSCLSAIALAAADCLFPSQLQKCGLSRIGNPRALNPGHGVQGMHLYACGAYYVSHGNTPDGKGISNKESVAAPRKGFRAQDGGTCIVSNINQLLQGRGKFRCLHIVGKALKRSIFPSGIW